MPVVARGKRVVEKATGKTVPGGTHKTVEEAKKHAAAINIAHAKKKGHRVGKRKK